MFRQVSLLYKRWGVYGITLICSMVFNRSYPGYISSVLFYSILMLPIISLLHMGLTYTVFELSHDVDQRFVSKGDTLTYRLSLYNSSYLILAPMRVHYISSEDLFHLDKASQSEWFVIYPKSQQDLHKQLTCFYRGNYPVGIDYIRIQDFFGFFSIVYKEIEQHKILVYPNLLEFKSSAIRQVLSETAESIVGHDITNSTVFTDIRQYMPGDALNKIHWKLSAKKGTWISKEYTGHITNTTYFFLDTCDFELSNEQRVIYEDYMIEGSMAMIYSFLKEHVHLKLYYDYHGINMVETKRQSDFDKFYDVFAHLSFYHENAYFDMISKVMGQDHESAHLIFATQQIQPNLVHYWVQLKNRGHEITVIMVPVSRLNLQRLKNVSDERLLQVLNSSSIPIYSMGIDEGSLRLEVF